MSDHPTLFSPITIGPVELRNRVEVNDLGSGSWEFTASNVDIEFFRSEDFKQ